VSEVEVKLTPQNEVMVGLLGHQDEVLRQIQRAFPDTTISVRGNEITIGGAQSNQVSDVFRQLTTLVERGQSLDEASVARTIAMVSDDKPAGEILTEQVLKSLKGRPITPKSSGQKTYVDAIREHVITFGLGPAGTGKSYLAIALAVQALQDKKVNRIILTRPAVEAGERLGFLPGDIMAKVDPYLRPLYDALYDMMDGEAVQRLVDRGTIEIAPLAFMRGRTLNDSFVILDEAQNTSPEQMKMFLTRIGFGTKAVVTGDMTQVDLAHGRPSGLIGLEDIMSGVEGMAFVHLDHTDVVRHRIVQAIVNAYDRADRRVTRGGRRGH
jgi:phosphate starvation-inducible PhoH-like protein